MRWFIIGGILFLASLIGTVGALVLAWHDVYPVHCLIFSWIASNGLATMPKVMFSGFTGAHCDAPHFFPGVIECGIKAEVGSEHYALITHHRA